MQQENPLMDLSGPSRVPPFGTMKSEHFVPALNKAIETAEEKIAAIKSSPDAPTFANTIEVLEFAIRDIGKVYALFENMVHANGNEALQAIEEGMDRRAVQFENDMMMDEELFSRVNEVYEARATLGLTDEETTLLETTHKQFVRRGALLQGDEKQELREIGERLADLYAAFSRNVTASTKEYIKVIDDEDDLAGVPERAKKIYRQNAEEEGMPGKWVIRLSPPPIDILSHCENRALRREISSALSNVASQGKHDNKPLIMELVKLRQRNAELLGYPDFASFVIDDRMAESPQAVKDFLEGNERTYRPAAEQFLQQVKDYAQKTDGITDLQNYDMSFYSRRLKEETYNISMEELRPYFDLEKVFEGLCSHLEKLFGVTLTEKTEQYPGYHPDVKAYEVSDKESGEVVGVFYTDYYARPGAKKNGAWHQLFWAGTEDEIPVNINVCNFDRPAGGQPALLSLGEVRTVFHEAGHALHRLLSRSKYPSLNEHVSRDFVELPSQLQENWAMTQEVLNTFARHYETGEPLPAALIQKIMDMDTYAAGFVGLSQTCAAMLDMEWHTTDPQTIKSVESLERAVDARFSLFPDADGLFSTHFSHIFATDETGYAAGYYGYKWAEVLEADIFGEFKRNGLYDRETAGRLLNTIYSKGASVEPMALFQEMMGRKPDATALYRREGLMPDAPVQKVQKPSSGPRSPRI